MVGIYSLVMAGKNDETAGRMDEFAVTAARWLKLKPGAAKVGQKFPELARHDMVSR